MKQDYEESVKWYLKAAGKGYAPAEAVMGHRYRTGHGVTADYAESVRWFRKAAEHGSTDAEYCLGEMYRDGSGVGKDDALAVSWFRKAAEKGLGACRERARGDVPLRVRHRRGS